MNSLILESNTRKTVQVKEGEIIGAYMSIFVLLLDDHYGRYTHTTRLQKSGTSFR